jgi:hypothetical protein
MAELPGPFVPANVHHLASLRDRERAAQDGPERSTVGLVEGVEQTGEMQTSEMIAAQAARDGAAAD